MRAATILTAILSLLLSPSCDRHDGDKKTTAKKPQIKKPKHDPSKEVEALTGAHTRMVWSECLKTGDSDTYATGDGLVLMGLDTRDGLGERVIIDKVGNYARPLLTSDGKTILFTDKNTVRKSGKKHYRPLIYRTDWKGAKPVRLAEGYAADTWHDPATGKEWVYAVQDIRATKGVSLEAQRMVRFPLEDPSKVETVYDDTPITPDNVQFSRDGTQACGLFPWPHAGLLTLSGGKWTARQLTIGCWTSHCPDNSGVMWAFDGDHKKVHVFADAGAEKWQISFADAPNVKGRELYHPRWTNHPRFIVATGPYTKQKGQNGSVINKGGSTAQVLLARLSPKADTIEGWVQITDDKSGESYPDAWIEGGDNASLEGRTMGRTIAPVVAEAWPARAEGLLFLWRNRVSLNTFARRDGRKHEARVEGREAARYGRLGEMQLDGGSFEVEHESTEGILAALQEKSGLAFEAVLLPQEAGSDETPGGLKPIFAAPGFFVGSEGGKVVVGVPGAGFWESAETLPAHACHLVVNRPADATKAFEVYVNGRPLTLGQRSAGGVKDEPAVRFGGGWNGGLLNVALYDRVFTAEDAGRSGGLMQERIAKLPPAPPRVRLIGKLVELSAMPTAEGIDPYTSALVEYVYEVEKVLEGEFKEPRVLVKHWAMLDLHPVKGLPRELGRSYELALESATDHKHLEGERVMQDTTAFDLQAWFDVAPPRVVPSSP